MRNPGETIDVSLPNGNHPYGVSLWDETFQCARPAKGSLQNSMHCSLRTEIIRWACKGL